MRLFVEIGTNIVAVGLMATIGCGAPAPENPPSETVETEPTAPAPAPSREPEPEPGERRVAHKPIDEST